MFDLASKFNKFYSSHVVLSQGDQDNLYAKKNLNIQRLKDGLKEYNDEFDTAYSIVETCVQGSMAISTIIQNDEGDYDIDVAIVYYKRGIKRKSTLKYSMLYLNNKGYMI